MGHLIPMNLQLNAEVGDKGMVKGDIVPSPGEEGGWSPGEMASLQREWAAVSWGSRGLSFGPLSRSAGPSHKGQLDSRLASSGGGGSSTPAWPPPRVPSKEVPLGIGGGDDGRWGLSTNPFCTGIKCSFS